jgi:hypothetical protein
MACNYMMTTVRKSRVFQMLPRYLHKSDMIFQCFYRTELLQISYSEINFNNSKTKQNNKKSTKMVYNDARYCQDSVTNAQ